MNEKKIFYVYNDLERAKALSKYLKRHYLHKGCKCTLLKLILDILDSKPKSIYYVRVLQVYEEEFFFGYNFNKMDSYERHCIPVDFMKRTQGVLIEKKVLI